MDVLRSRTAHVFGRSAAAGGPGSGADATALGVYAAIEASVEEAGLSGVSEFASSSRGSAPSARRSQNWPPTRAPS